MAAPVVKTGSVSTYDSGTTATWEVPLPTGVASGEIIALVVVTDSSHTISAVSGFTQLDVTLTDGSSDSSMSAFYKVSSGSEAATQDVEFSVAELGSAVVWVVQGGDVSTPLGGTSVGTTGSGSSRSASMTTTVADALVFGVFGTDPSSEITMTWAGDVTEVVVHNRSGNAHISAGSLVKESAGSATVAGSWSTSDNATELAFAFRPSGGAPPTPAGWVRASSVLSPEEDTRAGLISTSTKSGTSIGVSAVFKALPDPVSASLWLVDANTGAANGYELRLDDGTMELRYADDGESTVLDSAAATVEADDEVSLVIVDGVVAGIVNDDQVVNVVDAAQSGPWYAGLEGADDALQVGAVGFGTFSGDVPDPPLDPEPDPPSAAVSLTVSEDPPGTIKVGFSLPTAPATGYAVRYKAGLSQSFSGPADGTEFASGTGAPEDAVSVSLAGFTPGEAYTVGVWVYDSDTELFSAASTDDVTLAAYPEPPESVSLSADGAAVTASFAMPAVNVTGYAARFKTGASQPFASRTDGSAFDAEPAATEEAVEATSSVSFPDGTYTVAVWTRNESIYSQSYTAANVTVSSSEEPQPDPVPIRGRGAVGIPTSAIGRSVETGSALPGSGR